MERERVAPGIYKVSAGVYDIFVSTGLGIDGKYGQVTKRFNGTLAAAKNKKTEMQREVKEGTLAKRPTDAPKTMTELHQRYMQVKSKLSEGSKSQYEYLWTLLEPSIGTQKIDKLTGHALDVAYGELMADLDLSPNTVIKAHKHVKAMLARAMKWGIVRRNVAEEDATPPNEVPINIKPPTKEQVRKLVAGARKQEFQFGSLIYLAATTGARRGELAGLRWGDVYLDLEKIRVENQVNLSGQKLAPLKTKRHRDVPIDAGTIAMLKEHREFCDEIADGVGATISPKCFVFSPAPGNRTAFRKDGLTWRFRKLSKIVGVEGCRLHDLRHYVATKLLAAGISAVVVAERLGMSVEVLHKTYGHSDARQHRKAADDAAL